VYEQITVVIDRRYGEGNYRSYSIHFIGRLIRIVEAGHTRMRLYAWADRSRLLYLVHVEEDKLGNRRMGKQRRLTQRDSLRGPAFLLWLPFLSCARLTYHEPVRTDQHNQEQEQRHGELQILHPDATAPK
jgi:hypothetical protein